MGKNDFYDFKIDMVQSWLDYHFKTYEDKYVFRKMIRKQVFKMLGKYWNNYDFHDYIADETIKDLARRDWHPFCNPIFVRLVISDVFYHKHIKFMKKYAGIKVKRKKRSR